MKLKFLILFTLILVLVIPTLAPATAHAEIRKTEQADGQILYQSRHRLQDQEGQSWQVVLFKREQENTENPLKLRLVGFPGRAKVAHPQPLVLESKRQAWQAQDLFATESPAPNVGQYNLGEVISQLSQQNNLLLKIPQTNGEETILKVPGVIILEWKIVAGNQ
jgi:hypothetical protein